MCMALQRRAYACQYSTVMRVSLQGCLDATWMWKIIEYSYVTQQAERLNTLFAPANTNVAINMLPFSILPWVYICSSGVARLGVPVDGGWEVFYVYALNIRRHK